MNPVSSITVERGAEFSGTTGPGLDEGVGGEGEGARRAGQLNVCVETMNCIMSV